MDRICRRTQLTYLHGSQYCQTIRNNNNKARTPKWAVKYGLVKPLDERGGKHQWAGRYDGALFPALSPAGNVTLTASAHSERLPDSSRREYDDPSSSSTLPSTNETWDGRGPEPPVKDAATNRNGLSARPPPSTGESEEFFPSGSQAGGSIKGGSSIKKGKKKGLKGLFGNRRSRYENQEPEGAGGDRFEKMNSAHGVAATPVERTGYEIDDIAPSLGENRGREEEYADEFERELNGGGRKATANGNADPWAIPAKGNDDPWAIKSPKEDSQTAQGSKDRESLVLLPFLCVLGADETFAQPSTTPFNRPLPPSPPFLLPCANTTSTFSCSAQDSLRGFAANERENHCHSTAPAPAPSSQLLPRSQDPHLSQQKISDSSPGAPSAKLTVIPQPLIGAGNPSILSSTCFEPSSSSHPQRTPVATIHPHRNRRLDLPLDPVQQILSSILLLGSAPPSFTPSR